jgi:uncharacterized protein
MHLCVQGHFPPIAGNRRRYDMLKQIFIAAGTALTVTTAVMAADEVTLPKTITLTSYDVGGTAYNQAIAVGKALQDAYGVSLRVIGTANDQAKLAPVRDGRMPFSLAGSDVFFAFEGVKAYASPEWGPQRLRAVNLAGAENCLSYAVAADAGIKTMADFKGKRVPWVVASGSLQANAVAMLAFGGLTLDDVTLVEVPSYSAAFDAFINDQVDAMTTITTGGIIEKAVASARGVEWIVYDHDDQAAWDRMRAVNPHFSKRTATLAAGGLDTPLECIGVPYPDLITYSEDDDDALVYNFTKALDIQVDNYSKADPGTAGYAAEKQMFEWTVPYHPAAVKYYKEAGVWNDALQAHTDTLYARRDILAEAWKQMDGKSGDGFADEWMKVRAEALKAAGQPVYFN